MIIGPDSNGSGRIGLSQCEPWRTEANRHEPGRTVITFCYKRESSVYPRNVTTSPELTFAPPQ
jgi:hypothetical protein